MHHQVGITANGRGEMRVIAEHQTIVTYVVHRIARFHHRTKRHHLHHVFLFLAFHVSKQVIEALRNVCF